MELARRMMSEQLQEKFNSDGDPNKAIFPSLPRHIPNIQHLYSPSPTKSHDSVLSLNKAHTLPDLEKLPQLVELASSARNGYRREHTTLHTVRTSRIPPKVSSQYTRKLKDNLTSAVSPGLNEYNDLIEGDLLNQFNPNPMPYQARNFRSSTMIRNVPLSRRHNDSFCVTGPTLLKTKTVPFHTRPFLWDPVQRAQTSLLLEPSQRNKFKEEENLLEEVRGLKRKREVIPHRIEYGDLTVGGINTRLNERMDYGEELQKIKALPQIPPQCQELYTGRGIKLPPSHSSNRQPLTKIVSAPMPALRKTASFAVQTEDPMLQEREDKQEHFKVQPPAKIKRQSSIVRKSVKRKDSISLKPEKEPKTQMENEHMEDDEIPKEPSVEVTINEHDTMETEDIPPSPSPPPPEDRPESEMDIDVPVADEKENTLKPPPSVSPVKSVSPNPLKSVDLSSRISDERKKQLTLQFQKQDSNKDGHVTFPELSVLLSKDLTKSQKKYLKEVYELTSSSTFFGLEEFMTVMCLDENMVNQDNILKQAYDNLDFSKLQDDITHFVELFGSVDRRQMGSISTESLQGILSTALDQEIKNSTYKQILYDLGKDQNSSIDKMEFLADIPYFLTYRN